MGRESFRRSEREAEVALGKKIWELNLREEAEAVETHVWAIFLPLTIGLLQNPNGRVKRGVF